jgi:predicted metallopeptidase
MIKYPICQNCPNKNACGDFECTAIDELYRIYRQKKTASKTILIKNIARKLDLRDVEPCKDLRKLGQKIIKAFDEFSFIREYDIKIGYLISYERKAGEKIVYADCRKVQEVFKAYLPFDFIITFYDRNIGHLSEKQVKILMLHELRHIGLGMKGYKLRPHDIEDFKDILEPYGLDWDQMGKEVPDILAGD